MIESFSGVHEYRHSCAEAEVALELVADEGITDALVARITHEYVTAHLESGACPRCGGPLNPAITAGSRVVSCRCIPVCPDCGSDEALSGVLPIIEWPEVDRAEMLARAEQWMANAEPAVLDLDAGVIISESGVSKVKMREHPGGWLEFGHDDEDDDA
ncbi:hypothetical protein BH11ACT1_BH11ACT1_19190 [soil metagenome]